MTETEWLTSNDPQAMLEFLRGKASDRKLRLFTCAGCRRIWHLLTDERSRQAVEAAEQYADGHITDNELIAASDAAWDAAWDARAAARDAWDAANAAWAAAWAAARDAAWAAARDAARDAWAGARDAERKEQTKLLRDVFGNPWSPARLPLDRAVHLGKVEMVVCGHRGKYPATRLECSWLAWNDGTIPRLAEAIYQERAFDRMPILADALEDACCTNEEILSHCRQPDQHVRGCWAVDLLLGKE